VIAALAWHCWSAACSDDPPPPIGSADVSTDAAADVAADADAADGSARADSLGKIPPQCTADSQCPQATAPCRVAYCDALGACNTKATVDLMTCDDGNKCTSNDLCTQGACAGAAVDCNDNSECTSDYCLPAAGCIHDNLVKVCDVTDLCVAHACQGGACIALPKNPCDDSNPCTVDACKPGAGCTHSAVPGGPCDDHDGCTAADKCVFGTCKGKGKSCNDGNLCTTDGCDKSGNCTYAANALSCGEGGECLAHLCIDTACTATPTAKECADALSCTDNFCNTNTLKCDIKPAKDVTACDDGDACTTGEGCVGLGCIGGASLDCDDGDSCTADACDKAAGACVHFAANEGAACGKGNLCINGGVCAAGKCTGATKDCADDSPCTLDKCDAATGICIHPHAADGTPCQAGKACVAGACK